MDFITEMIQWSSDFHKKLQDPRHDAADVDSINSNLTLFFFFDELLAIQEPFELSDSRETLESVF